MKGRCLTAGEIRSERQRPFLKGSGSPDPFTLIVSLFNIRLRRNRFDRKFPVSFFHLIKSRPFQRRFIGRMEGEHEFTIQSCKQHAVAAVPLKQQFLVRNPVPCNIVIVGAGDSFHIAMLAETGPEHKKLPAF